MATLEKKLKKVEKNIIGLWKFRQRGKKTTWCTTFVFDGYYYDTYGKKTPEAALDAVQKELTKLNKKHRKPTKNKK